MVYCYETSDGVVVERMFPMGKAPQRIRTADGAEAVRSFAAEGASVPATKGWPMTCYASGVNAEQAGALRKELADMGVPTQVTSDGDPVYRDARHRRKALKARGIVDRNSFL